MHLTDARLNLLSEADFFCLLVCFFKIKNAPQRNGIRDHLLFKSEGDGGGENGGPRLVFGRTYGSLKGQKEGCGGLEIPFIRPYFHSFVSFCFQYTAIGDCITFTGGVMNFSNDRRGSRKTWMLSG